MKNSFKNINKEFNIILIIAMLILGLILGISYISTDSSIENQMITDEIVIPIEGEDIKKGGILKVENIVNRPMTAIVILLLFGIVLLTLFRCIALSKLSSKLTNHYIWNLDFGVRYGWLFVGLALLFTSVVELSFLELLEISIYWLIGLVVIWLIPNKLIK
jgi:hypothetical protein